MKKSLNAGIKKIKGGMPLNLQTFATARTFPEENIQDRETLSVLEAKTIDFVYRFNKDMRDFLNVLGLFNQRQVTEGYTINTKVAEDSAVLADGNVPEGEIIPLSYATFGEGASVKMTSKKWRKVTTYEAIQEYGFDEAVNRADRAVIGEIQAGVRNDLFDFVNNNAVLESSVAAGSLQGAVATAWGYLESLFEGANNTLAFVNPMDIAKYIATSDITLQTAFGVTYLQGFTNTTIIASNAVEQGTILATVPENLTLFYIPANSEGGQAFDLRTDESGWIGVGRDKENKTASIESIFITGIKLLPEIENGLVKVQIEEVTPEG